MTDYLYTLGSSEWVEAVEQGKEFPTESVLDAYVAWEEEDVYSLMKKKDTGETIPMLQPKLGNRRYARMQKDKVRNVLDAMNDIRFDYAPPGTRENTSCYTKAIFITLQFDANKFSIPESWLSVKGSDSVFNLFKAKLARYLKSKSYTNDTNGNMINKPIISYSSHARKEAQESGMLHIHMILILDRPIKTHYHSNSGTWRLNWNTYVQPIKDLWHESIGCESSYVDVQAIVGTDITAEGKARRNVMNYLLKYVTKAVNLDNRKALLTHALKKLLQAPKHKMMLKKVT